MHDEGLNQWLKDTYGTTIEGLALFRVVWSTELREKRRGTFCDFLDDIFIREVTEVRDSLKYPFAQERWVIETLMPTPPEVLGTELFEPYTYEGIYIFQDKEENPLPMTRDMVEAAIYIYLTSVRRPMKDRIDFQMERLARKELSIRNNNKDMISDSLRSPAFLVLDKSFRR
jgi:hypothetical protein